MGSIIEAFACDEAMVKVGTVIDPDMRDELHVTVVVTGLDAAVKKPVKVVDNTAVTQTAAPVKAARMLVDDGQEPDYSKYDAPVAQRMRDNAVPAAKPTSQEDMDYLDLPAFLRRQAD